MTSLSQSPAWQQLRRLAVPRLTDLFDSNSKRAAHYRLTAAGIRLDYSRQPITDDILNALFDLAQQEDVTGWRDKMFAGAAINATEQRPVLHWQWRLPHPPADLAGTRERMRTVADQIRTGAWRGATGKTIKHIVNIGIGGSDQGPRLIYDGLVPLGIQDLQLHFVSNIDPVDLDRVTSLCDADEILFVIVSKSMNTLETRLNAEKAKAWLIQNLGMEADLSRHLLAVTTNLPTAAALGIPAENCFGFSSGVGGRYSIWSPVSLAVMIVLGSDAFDEFLAGAAEMDEHFQTASLTDNMPVLLALLSLWQINFNGTTAEAVLPYSTHLALLPAYLQQLVMESNGKSVTRDGAPVDYATAPVIFGSAGTLGQHSFHQLLHQGTSRIGSDFILIKGDQDDEMQRWLLANGLAQSAALLYGHEDADPHRAHPGNRASNLLLIDRLTPRSLGALLALYEHKTFVQGILWRINPFDQFGVELGKIMAADTFNALSGHTDTRIDTATAAFIADL